MVRSLFVGVLLCVLALPAPGRAQAAWFDVRVPGSLEGLLRAAGLDAEPAGVSRLTPYLLHRLQEAAEATEPEAFVNRSGRDGAGAWPRPGSEGIRTYLNAFRVLRTRWEAVEQRAGRVHLDAARERRSRGSLQDFLVGLGLGLARNRGDSVYRVVLDGGEPRSPYERWRDSMFSAAGWPQESVRSRLNEGGTLQWDLEHFVFSLPVAPGLWRSFLDETGSAADAGAVELAADEAAELLARVISDPVWSRVYGALAVLDAAVTEYLAEHPDVFRRPSASLAVLLETLAQLPRGHRRFVLDAWQDGPDRQSGVDTLWRILERMPDDPAERSMFLDPAAVLRAVMVNNDGSPVGPASREFWNVAFGERTVRQRDLDALSSAWEGRRLDAAFVLAATLGAPPNVGRSRLQALGFLQRVFHDAEPADVPVVLAVARAYSRHSMLLLSLERMGIRDAGVYAPLLRTASQFSGTRDVPGWREALFRFQGGIALVERARLARVLSAPAAGDLLVALAELPADRGVTDWLTERLLPALDLARQPDFASRAVEKALLSVLAGVVGFGTDVSDAALTEWEGLQFRFDREAMQLERFERRRGELHGPSLDAVLTVWAQRRRLAAASATVEDASAAAEILQALATGMQVVGPRDAGPDARAVTHARRLQSAAAALGEVAERRNLGRLGDVVATLGAISEALAADALSTLVYAVQLAPVDGLIDAGLAARHDFGADPNTEAAFRRTPWTSPSGITTIEGWSVQGSLLSLDLALAHLYLPRVSRVLPSGGQRFLALEDLTYLTQAVALFNPAAVNDAQVAGIAEAIRRGRRRVRRLAADASGVAELAREVRLAPPRYGELERAAAAGAEELDRLLRRTELFWLGLQGEGLPGPENWGAPTTGLDGCLCLRMPLPGDFGIHGNAARPLAFRFAELQLLLAEEVDRLALPASIVGDLLPMATRELLDGARVTHSGDIAALVEYVDELSASRIEDYVASLVYSGPFYPPDSAGLGSAR